MRIFLLDDDAGPEMPVEDGAESPDGEPPITRPFMWYYTAALREAGFEVDESSRVSEAIAKLNEKGQPYDLFIIDMGLADENAFGGRDSEGGTRTGLFMAEHIRARVPHTRIVIFSQYNSKELIGEIRSIRYCTHLAKPDYTPDEFVVRIRKLLGLPD
jgi:DNA-binding NarL/FixJ family response regulator